jgi:predicted signal transduction protein with EAL and GGDEF domain
MDHLYDLNFQVNQCESVVVYVHTIRVFYLLAHEDGYSYSQAVIEFSYVLYVLIVCGFQSLWINSLDVNTTILGNTLLIFFFSVISVPINVICLS